MVHTLGITIWQNISADNSDIITIQNQLTEIQQTLNDTPSPDLTGIESKIQEIIDTSDISSVNKQLDDILQEIKEYKQTP